MSSNTFVANEWADSNAKLTQNQIARANRVISEKSWQEFLRDLNSGREQRDFVVKLETDHGFNHGVAQFVAQAKGDWAIKMGLCGTKQGPSQAPKPPTQTGTEGPVPKAKTYSFDGPEGTVEYDFLPKGVTSEPNSKGITFTPSEDMLGIWNTSDKTGKKYPKYLSIRKIREYCPVLADYAKR